MQLSGSTKKYLQGIVITTDMVSLAGKWLEFRQHSQHLAINSYLFKSYHISTTAGVQILGSIQKVKREYPLKRWYSLKDYTVSQTR